MRLDKLIAPQSGVGFAHEFSLRLGAQTRAQPRDELAKAVSLAVGIRRRHSRR